MNGQEKQAAGGGRRGQGREPRVVFLVAMATRLHFSNTTHPLPAFLPSFLLRLSLTYHFSSCAKEQKLSVSIFGGLRHHDNRYFAQLYAIASDLQRIVYEA